VTNRFVWVAWNRHKRVYDGLLACAMAIYLLVFVVVSSAMAADAPDPMVLGIHATGTLAIVMLHVILCIGPLARFTDRVAPLLYNRRHFGVAMFGVGLLHAALVLLYYGGFGSVNPIAAVLLDGRSFLSLGAFPYELLGFAGLLVLFVMAATSHDFWLDLLGAAVWKWIHMGVYAAYALLVGHIALGSLAGGGRGGLSLVALGVGVVAVAGLHLVAGIKEMTRDESGRTPIDDLPEQPDLAGWVEVGSVDDIPEGRATVVCLSAATAATAGASLAGERVAVFRNQGRVSAVTNVCAHQGGPLGEGKLIDGCVTCPWHGYQFRVEDGQSPPPYTEKIATYRVRVEGRTVMLDPNPLAPGTRVEPAFFEASPDDDALFEDPDVDRADGSVDASVDLESPEAISKETDA
jgi:sulfoxide reductase heme-binding subunit YedZ